jgi:hypothetical protein
VCAALARFVNFRRRMPARATDWLVAAACCEGPRPPATFADLPAQNRGEIVRIALVSTAAAAYFVTLGILTQPIPSRSLLTPGALLRVPPARSALPPARVAVRADPVEPASPRSVRAQHARTRAAYEAAAVADVPGSGDRAAAKGARQPRRNFFSRFLRGVFGGGQPAAAKADSL